jgi:hypothetical protein
VTCNPRPPAVSQMNSRIASRGLILGLGLLVLLHLATLRAYGERQDPRKPYALIFGTVWGPDDHPLYGVKVKIRRADQKRAKWELYSNHAGEFAQRLPAGKADYVVWADTKGLKSLTGKKLEPGSEVTVHIESDERADVGLHLN